MIRATYENYRLELLEAPALIQLLFSWTLCAWGMLFLHARALDRLAAR
jgi:hypothetical protein